MATTPNYSFSVYSSTDTDVRFLDFRVATAGSQSTSNFYVIDTVLKQHSDAIDSINATPSAFVVKGTYSSGSLYTASVANYPGYKNEQLIVLSLNQKNTGAVQININGTTNKDVMKYGSDGVLKAVDAGDFVANSPVLCLYDGTRFVVIGITSASSITVTGEAGDILQIADDGTIESSGKKAAQPNGIATLDENGNVVQVANMANSAAAVYSGEPVTIEYAGAQRIASITAYGENAQGGTTEAPVALTGISSITVNNDVTELPIPRPLRRVGDVKDKCITRVKSVYDKRIVLDGTEIWTEYTNESWQGAGYHVYKFNDADVLISQYIASNKYPYRRGAINFKGTLGVTSGAQSILFSVVEQKTVDDWKAYLAAQKAAGTPLIIYRQSTAYDGTNGLDVCLMKYQTGFVELNGTEASHVFEGMFYLDYSAAWPTPANRVNGVCSHYPYGTYGKGKIGLADNGTAVVYNPNGAYTVDTWKAHLAAQKAAGTPVQVAYQLATPEVYATDPVDFDNAAGPLAVMTGGELEVRMTELVGSRSPEIVAKMDKATYDADGDGVVDEAEKVSNALTLKNAAGEVVATFDGSEAAILQLTAALVGALGKTEKAADSSKLAGLTPVIDNPGPSNRNSWYFPFTGTNNKDGTRKYYACIYADRATNLSMSLSGTTLTINYS